MALTCPHCQSPVEQADRSAEEILCPACGSSFRVQQDTTIAWSSDRGPRTIGKYEQRVALRPPYPQSARRHYRSPATRR
jgi:predicted amidophosphoribosyltransferase